MFWLFFNTGMQSIDDQKKEYLNKNTGERGAETASASPKQQQPPPFEGGAGVGENHTLNANQYNILPLNGVTINNIVLS